MKTVTIVLPTEATAATIATTTGADPARLDQNRRTTTKAKLENFFQKLMEGGEDKNHGGATTTATATASAYC